VKLDGEPLEGVTVAFSAISKGLPAEFRHASAVTDADGMYVLKKVYPAEYMITLNDTAAEGPPPVGEESSAAMAEAVPSGGNSALAKYNVNSPLRAEVDAGSTTHNFDLKSGDE